MGAAVVAAVGILIASGTLTGTHGTGGTVRLRPMQSMGRKLIADGMEQSGTFRRLVQDLDRSDVIVYVELRSDMPSHIVGSLRFITPSATDRFLKIALNRNYDWSTLIALLGHELQHVHEVASAREVRSPGDLRAFYHRVGIRVGPNAYDSREAQRTGQIVRAELRGGSRPVLAGRHASLDRILLGSGSIEAGAQ